MCVAVICSHLMMDKPCKISLYRRVITTRSPELCNDKEGASEGEAEGNMLGGLDGNLLGKSEGVTEGKLVGLTEGIPDGADETDGLGVLVVG